MHCYDDTGEPYKTTNKRAYVGYEQRCDEEAEREVQPPRRGTP